MKTNETKWGIKLMWLITGLLMLQLVGVSVAATVLYYEMYYVGIACDCEGAAANLSAGARARSPILLPSENLEIELLGDCKGWGFESFEWARSYRQGQAYYPLLSFNHAEPEPIEKNMTVCAYKNGRLLGSGCHSDKTAVAGRTTVMIMTSSWIFDYDPDRITIRCDLP